MKQNELIPFTFRDTGVTIMIKKVSPLLGMELRRSFPPPEPPVQEVDYGGSKVLEKNYAHPGYADDLQKYNMEFEKRLRVLAVKRGTAPGVETGEWEKDVSDLRTFWQEEYKMALPEENDWMAFVSYIAVGSDGDFEDLFAQIMSRSTPTEAAVQKAAGSFRN